MSAAILHAYQNGAIYDAWTEYFSMERWTNAFAACGIDPDFYTARTRPDDEIFPWEHIDAGVTRRFLLSEWKRAQEGVVTPNCREKCSGCGCAIYGGGVCFEA